MQPINVLMSPDKQNIYSGYLVRLLNPKYFLSEKTAYMRSISDRDYRAALSPKMMEGLQSNDTLP